MNHFSWRSPTRDPLSCSNRRSHGPRASLAASTHFRVATRPRPHFVLIGLKTPGAAEDWAERPLVAVKFSASLKRAAFPDLDVADQGGSFGEV